LTGSQVHRVSPLHLCCCGSLHLCSDDTLRARVNVLYFHGFASSPASAKITALRPLLAPQRIELDTPDLNVPSFEELDFEAMVVRALDAATPWLETVERTNNRVHALNQ